jgi:cysteine desulfurase
VSFSRIDGEALLVSLEGVAVSSGAACTAAEPSHVLLAMGLPKDLALASLRFGIGRSTSEADIDEAVRLVAAAVSQLQTVNA